MRASKEQDTRIVRIVTIGEALRLIGCGEVLITSLMYLCPERKQLKLSSSARKSRDKTLNVILSELYL